MKVADLMTPDVKFCALNETLNSAARIMWDHDCGCVPVVDAGRRLAGIVTDRDLAMAAYTQGLPLTAIPVERAMSSRVISCSPGDGVETAHRLLRTHEIHRLPVVDSGGALVGIVSLSDLAHRAHDGRSAAPNAKEQHATEFFETVTAIRRRRPPIVAAATPKPGAAAKVGAAGKRPRTSRRKPAADQPR